MGHPQGFLLGLKGSGGEGREEGGGDSGINQGLSMFPKGLLPLQASLSTLCNPSLS